MFHLTLINFMVKRYDDVITFLNVWQMLNEDLKKIHSDIILS